MGSLGGQAFLSVLMYSYVGAARMVQRRRACGRCALNGRSIFHGRGCVCGRATAAGSDRGRMGAGVERACKYKRHALPYCTKSDGVIFENNSFGIRACHEARCANAAYYRLPAPICAPCCSFDREATLGSARLMTSGKG